MTVTAQARHSTMPVYSPRVGEHTGISVWRLGSRRACGRGQPCDLNQTTSVLSRQLPYAVLGNESEAARVGLTVDGQGRTGVQSAVTKIVDTGDLDLSTVLDRRGSNLVDQLRILFGTLDQQCLLLDRNGRVERATVRR